MAHFQGTQKPNIKKWLFTFKFSVLIPYTHWSFTSLNKQLNLFLVLLIQGQIAYYLPTIQYHRLHIHFLETFFNTYYPNSDITQQTFSFSSRQRSSAHDLTPNFSFSLLPFPIQTCLLNPMEPPDCYVLVQHSFLRKNLVHN